MITLLEEESVEQISRGGIRLKVGTNVNFTGNMIPGNFSNFLGNMIPGTQFPRKYGPLEEEERISREVTEFPRKYVPPDHIS